MQALNNEQRKQWFDFENGLKLLNRNFMITRGRARMLIATINFLKTNTAAVPPSMQWDRIQRYTKSFDKMSGQVRALNYAYSLTHSGAAALVPSTVFPGDLDIVADQNQLNEPEIKAATFNRAETFKDSDLGYVTLIPLLIKGVALLGGSLVVLGITNAVTESAVKQKSLI